VAAIGSAGQGPEPRARAPVDRNRGAGTKTIRLLTVTAVVGVIVGVPLGIVIGRQLRMLFARNINAAPDPTVPVVSVFLVALGALIFANVVAAIPGRIAARPPTPLVLRTE
jgi:NhaP-type Na+/H+ or K+/H+ antiporter